jgi:hypothetical protein
MRTKPLLGRKAWFGPRRLGWGLAPVAPEGWVVTGVAVATAVGLAAVARHDRWAVLLVVVVLLIIVFAKGTSPGGSREWEEFQASKDHDGK